MRGAKLAVLMVADLVVFVKENQQRFAHSQLTLADALTTHAKAVVEALPSQQRKIFSCIANYYSVGVKTPEITRITRVPTLTLSAQLSRLVNAGLVERTQAGTYRITLKELLLVNAARWDARFPRWLAERRKKIRSDEGDVLDEFIAQIEAKLV